MPTKIMQNGRKKINVEGTIHSNSREVALVGHTHSTSDISGLDTKISNATGSLDGKITTVERKATDAKTIADRALEQVNTTYFTSPSINGDTRSLIRKMLEYSSGVNKYYSDPATSKFNSLNVSYFTVRIPNMENNYIATINFNVNYRKNYTLKIRHKQWDFFHKFEIDKKLYDEDIVSIYTLETEGDSSNTYIVVVFLTKKNMNVSFNYSTYNYHFNTDQLSSIGVDKFGSSPRVLYELFTATAEEDAEMIPLYDGYFKNLFTFGDLSITTDDLLMVPVSKTKFIVLYKQTKTNITLDSNGEIVSLESRNYSENTNTYNNIREIHTGAFNEFYLFTNEKNYKFLNSGDQMHPEAIGDADFIKDYCRLVGPEFVLPKDGSIKQRSSELDTIERIIKYLYYKYIKRDTALTGRINGVLFNGKQDINITVPSLSTNHTINGVAFNGTQDITITARASGGNADTLGNLRSDQYVKVTDVANAAGKIPRFNAAGHLVYPDGHEEWIE